MPVPQVLLVSDDPELVARIADVVKGVGDCQFRAVGASFADDPQSLLSPRPALVVVHCATPQSESSVQSFLQSAAAQRPIVPTLVVSESQHSGSMLLWMRLGAVDCLLRPLNLGRLSFLVDSFTLKARYDHRSQGSKWLEFNGVEPFCIDSEEMARLSELSKRAAIRDANILITGETGTGKTHLAKLIHAMSLRAAEPFVTVNCAAIPESLMESELFGHVRGAFTDATRDHEGVFARVRRGTLFLDEVDSLPLRSQAKLLHAVDEGAFLAVGDSRTQHFQGRLVTATNQDLDKLAEQGSFRRDLLFRLKVLHLTIPPLRARRAEIPALAQTYIEKSARRQGCLPKPLNPAALDLVQAYDWPGNVRELENVLEQSMAFCLTHEIRPADLPVAVVGGLLPSSSSEVAGPPARDACPKKVPVSQGTRQFSLEQGRAAGEIQALAIALQANDNNRTETARQLGISRSALYKRLRKLGLLGAD